MALPSRRAFLALFLLAAVVVADITTSTKATINKNGQPTVSGGTIGTIDFTSPSWLIFGSAPCTGPDCTFAVQTAADSGNKFLATPADGSSGVMVTRTLFPLDMAAGGADTNCLKISGGLLSWGTCGAGGGIGTDAFWAAKGDLAGGTANDTAAVLTVGANDSILMAESGETTGLKWNAAATTTELADVTTGAEGAGTSDTYARGDHTHHITLTGVAHFPIGFPGAAENAGGWYFPAASTITEFRCVLVGSSTPSVTPNIKFGTDRSAAGTSVTTSPAACTNTTGGATQTLNNTAISAGSYMWAITTAQSGNVSWAILDVTYTTP